MRNTISLLLLLLAPAAHALNPLNGVEPTGGVALQYSSTVTVRGLSISNAAATSVILSTAAGYRSVTVQNVCATSADIFCGDNATTLATSGNGEGFLVARSSGPQTFTLRPGMDFFCLAGGGAACQAIIIRGR